MIPLLFMLCVSWSGGDDCSFTWEYVPNDEVYKMLWMSQYQDAKISDLENIGAFTDFHSKRVVLNETKWISHEARHIICYLEFQHKHAGVFDYDRCNQKIDTRDIMEQSTRKIHETPEPPQRTAKFKDSLYGRILPD